MSYSVVVSKGELFNILGSTSITFAKFLTGNTDDGRAVRLMFENIDEIDLTNSLVQDILIPLLQSHNVLSTADINKIDQYILQYQP